LAYAIFAHCFTCSKNYKAVVNISRALARARVAVLRFDFTGLGESEGDFAETTFSSNVDDLLAAADFLEAEYEAPAILIGHSLGGAAVLQAARRVPACQAVVTINAPAEPQQVKRHLTNSLEDIEECGKAEVLLAGRPFTIKKEFLDDLEAQNMSKVIESLDRALLVFHSPADSVVGIDNARQIYATADEPKTFVSLQDADHLLTREEDSEYVGAVIAAWVARYIGAPQKAARDDGAPDGQVVVRTGRARYHTAIFAGDHALVADEPKEVGGGNCGPTPFALLMSALGACTTITLRMYSDRKDWPLEEIGVRLRHRKLTDSETRKKDGERSVRDEISQTIELIGPLDDAQRERLLEIAQRCPIHRALASGIAMPVEIATAEDG
jgi:putative redox protein